MRKSPWKAANMTAASLNHDPEPFTRAPTLLCVDDDLDAPGAIELWLRRFDVTLVRAFDGMEGFGEALAHKPDLILMDLDMPYGDGMSMLECFRRNAQTEHIPIIILTGMRDPKLRRKLISMGADQFLMKPVQFDDLMHEISHFINLSERR